MTFIGKFAAALALIALFILGLVWGIGALVEHKLAGPDPVTIASGSLEGLREQNRLSAFAARFVAVSTSTQSQFGLQAKKTLIMPGLVEYHVDMGRLSKRDVTWDAKTRTLGVVLPPVEASAPQIDLTQIREYGEGGILSTITDADARLEKANRAAGQRELVRQASGAVPIRLARDATRRAVERSFALPLRAAGLDASVKVRFADEAKDGSEVWDTTKSIAEVLANRS
ncbi:hypothetical protein GCM10008023_04080 [Sphingomonas glacialis]|uniref:DUF4230 domain-containing protein n=1 Tax=Sphingomonas glacialis TaxID=658225 RepID=A0ABQ3LAD0_9SPHN|nr:DUF4230 domain-containing protein [Sphingomonas glacialis]GHH08537.1 hypothetical protein GCM10008023_04080 [Sphingomonas glacialis]